MYAAQPSVKGTRVPTTPVVKLVFLSFNGGEFVDFTGVAPPTISGVGTGEPDPGVEDILGFGGFRTSV